MNVIEKIICVFNPIALIFSEPCAFVFHILDKNFKSGVPNKLDIIKN